jgi:hypothetical protein
MAEATRAKFFLVKYFFLGNALLLLTASTLFFLQNSESPKGKAVSFILSAAGLVFISLHFMIASDIKKVAISKKKISIVDKGKVKSYHWEEVKSIKFIPFINMYRAYLKKKRMVYFLPPNNSEALFGMFIGKQDFIPKKVGKIARR